MKKLELPKIKRPQLSGPKVKGPKVEPPKILVDLYKDLRDRRLLLPFAILAIALVIVPLSLSKPSSPGSTATAASGGTGPVSAAEPAVLAETVGIRNYHKRLARLNQKDPFKRHVQLGPMPGGNPGRLAPPPAQSSPSPTPAPTGSTTPTPTPAPTGSSVPPVSTPPVTTTGSTTTQTVTVHSTPPQPHLYHAVVDLKIGLPNQLVKHAGVKALTELPHKSNPVVALLGGALDRSEAEFLVSRDVTSVQGGTSCSPTRSGCQLLVMKPGGKAKLQDSTSGKTYVLKVLAIRLVQVKGTKAKSGTTAPGKSHGGSAVASSADFGSGLSR